MVVTDTEVSVYDCLKSYIVDADIPFIAAAIRNGL